MTKIDLSIVMNTNKVNIKGLLISLNMMMLLCIKQHLSNIWSSIHKKVKQHWCWVEKRCCLLKKACIFAENNTNNSQSPKSSQLSFQKVIESLVLLTSTCLAISRNFCNNYDSLSLYLDKAYRVCSY